MIKAVPTTGLVTALYRLWFAIPLLWVAALLVPGARFRRDRAWLTGSLIGGALFGGHQILFFSAIKMTSVANVTIIGALQPVLVLLAAAPLFGERAAPGTAAWSLVALAGTALVVLGTTDGAVTTPAGDTLAVANLLVFTGYFLVSKRFRPHVDPSGYVVGMTTVAGTVVLGACLVAGEDLGSPRGAQWLVLLFLAIAPGTLGHWLVNWAHAHVTAFVVSMMFLAVPVLSTGGALVLLGEPLGPLQLLGGAIVLVSIAMIVQASDAQAGEELAESAAETDAP